MGRNKNNKISELFKNKILNELPNFIFRNKKSNIVKFKLPDPLCFYCNSKDIRWKHVITNDYSCDECLPRGCSCRLYELSNFENFSIDNFDYEKDENDLELPCEDWIQL